MPLREHVWVRVARQRTATPCQFGRCDAQRCAHLPSPRVRFVLLASTRTARRDGLTLCYQTSSRSRAPRHSHCTTPPRHSRAASPACAGAATSSACAQRLLSTPRCLPLRVHYAPSRWFPCHLIIAACAASDSPAAIACSAAAAPAARTVSFTAWAGRACRLRWAAHLYRAASSRSKPWRHAVIVLCGNSHHTHASKFLSRFLYQHHSRWRPLRA